MMSTSKRHPLVILLSFEVLCLLAVSSECFVVLQRNSLGTSSHSCRSSSDDNIYKPTDEDWSQLQAEVARMRLEEANTRQFLTSGAKFLSYQQAKAWIAKNGYGWKNQDEWEEYIASGENLQWFLPSDPELYYSRTRNWISWDDYLGVMESYKFLMGWFDESDDEKEEKRKRDELLLDEFATNEQQDVTSSRTNGERSTRDSLLNSDFEDPLDAYMKSLEGQTSQQHDNLKRAKRLDLDNEEEDVEVGAVLRNETLATEEAKSSSESLDESSSNPLYSHFHRAGEGSRKDDWESLALPTTCFSTVPFEKVFWTSTNTPEGRQWRRDHQVHCSTAIDPIYHFEELRDVLGTALLSEITQRFKQPTLVQQQTLSVVMNGNDALVTAATGQGKTLAYLWPLAVHIADQRHLDESETGPIGLVLVPTRELALQVHKQAQPMLHAAADGATSKAVIGGQGKYLLQLELRQGRGVELVVATPGRLLDVLSDKRGLSLTRTTFVVLDEADKMLYMGFEPQVRKILSRIRPDRQTLMLSATMGKRVEQVAKEWLSPNYVRISVGRTGQSSENVEQHVMVLPNALAKKEFLIEMLETFQKVGRTLVFVSTRDACEVLAKEIGERLSETVPVVTLHGDKHQTDRVAALKAFAKDGGVSVMIATDVAGRGLDVPQVTTVVNFDPAKNLDTHVHRIGRAGRLSKDNQQHIGSAYTLLTPDDSSYANILLHAFEREGREINADLRQLAAGGTGRTTNRLNHNGLGYNDDNLALGTPPAKRNRWR